MKRTFYLVLDPGFTHRPVASALPRCSRLNNDDQIFNSKISSNQKERLEKMSGENRTTDTLSNLNNKTLRKTRICSPMLHNFIRRVEKGEKFSSQFHFLIETLIRMFVFFSKIR